MKTGNRAREPFDQVLRRMAERDAAAHLLTPFRAPWADHPAVWVFLELRACPWCPETASDQAFTSPAPMLEAQVVPTPRRPGAAAVTVTTLDCELLTGRSLLLLARSAEAGVPLPSRRFVTRSVACAALLRHGGLAAMQDLVAALDAGETWADGLLGRGGPEPGAPAQRPCILPASTRCGRAGKAREQLDPHFVSPHLLSTFPDPVNRAYLSCRAQRVATSLGLTSSWPTSPDDVYTAPVSGIARMLA